MDEMSFFIQRLVGLRYCIIIFLIRGQINDIICYHRILRICFIYFTIWSFDKSILVNSRIGRKRVDQTDVRTLRRLDRTHSSVMGIMYVTDLETGTVSGKAAWSQRGKTSLMRKLGQRVMLIHKLRQLRTSEELLHRCSHRLDINQCLWGNGFHILRCHTLADYSLHTGETDPVLILQKLTDSTDTTVAQVVDVVVIADTILQVNIVINGSKDIFPRDMLWNQLTDTLANRRLNLFYVIIIFQNFFKGWVIN